MEMIKFEDFGGQEVDKVLLGLNSGIRVKLASGELVKVESPFSFISASIALNGIYTDFDFIVDGESEYCPLKLVDRARAIKNACIKALSLKSGISEDKFTWLKWTGGIGS